MQALIVFLLSKFISACGWLIRGGSSKLFNGPIKGGRLIGAAFSTLAFAFMVINLHWSLYLIPAYAVGWMLTVMAAWQPWYSIGQSTSPKRDEGYIGKILHPIFGVPVPATWSASRRIAYDSCGMFIRMLDSLPLFVSAALIIDFSWHSVFIGTIYSCIFSALIVIIYGAYNWFVPSKYRGDGKLNWSEFGAGWIILHCVVVEITYLLATIPAK